MIKNKHKKILIIGLCVLFIITTIAMAIMAENIIHTEHCCIENCPVCAIINISTNFVSNIIILLNANIVTLIAIIFLMNLVLKNNMIRKKTTLVELKIVLNN